MYVLYILQISTYFSRHANLTITSLGHATSEDVTFVGYKVPTDAIILADMDSVNNDRRTWGDPQKFRPERFIAEDGSLLKIEEFIPFFLGNSFSAIPYST